MKKSCGNASYIVQQWLISNTEIDFTIQNPYSSSVIASYELSALLDVFCQPRDKCFLITWLQKNGEILTPINSHFLTGFTSLDNLMEPSIKVVSKLEN